MDPEIAEKIKVIFGIIVLACGILLVFTLFFSKDEKEDLKKLISTVQSGDEKAKKAAAARLIRDFLPKEQYQKEVMYVITSYMPPDWHDKALDVMYPPKKSKELAK